MESGLLLAALSTLTRLVGFTELLMHARGKPTPVGYQVPDTRMRSHDLLGPWVPLMQDHENPVLSGSMI